MYLVVTSFDAGYPHPNLNLFGDTRTFITLDFVQIRSRNNTINIFFGTDRFFEIHRYTLTSHDAQ